MRGMCLQKMIFKLRYLLFFIITMPVLLLADGIFSWDDDETGIRHFSDQIPKNRTKKIKEYTITGKIIEREVPVEVPGLKECQVAVDRAIFLSREESERFSSLKYIAQEMLTRFQGGREKGVNRCVRQWDRPKDQAGWKCVIGSQSFADMIKNCNTG